LADKDRQRWNDRYRARRPAKGPCAFLPEVAHLLPDTGKVLDLAGGEGRNAFWLAERGLDVTIADISEVALARARERAEESGLSVQTLEVDLEEQPAPAGPWDLIVCVLYLDRPLLGRVHELLAPGGQLIFVQPTVRNRERHEHAAGYLLQEGEAPGLLNGLRLVHYDECWDRRGHHEARVVAINRMSA